MSKPPEHVLFDLDQTIVPWDTQLVFRSYVLQQEGWRRALTLVFILFLPLNKLLGAGLTRVCFSQRARSGRSARESL
ncbi:haloacid dehalogenase-like hydrolase [Akkermansiaceae bacterium]|nr:haloacid dehalogenase-like hydrolase [Akkermansiaceae bacterium]